MTRRISADFPLKRVTASCPFCDNDTISAGRERRPSQFPKCIVIIRNQNGFISGAYLLDRYGLRFFGSTAAERKINTERRSLPRFTVDIHEAPMLLHDAVYGG